MVEPIAEPSDVRDRINLPDDPIGGSGVSDTEIYTYLEDAAFEISLVDSGAMDDALRMQLEWRMAALKIRSIREGDRATQQETLGNMSKSFEVKSTEELKEWIKRHGPPGLVDEEDEFWHASIQG